MKPWAWLHAAQMLWDGQTAPDSVRAQVIRRGLLAMREAVLLRRERAHALLTARARVITIRMHLAFNAWWALPSSVPISAAGPASN